MRDILSANRPVEDRIVKFEKRPDDRQLGTDLGYGLMSSSNIELKDDEHFLRVQPDLIPVKVLAIWMYFLLVVTVTVLFLFDQATPKILMVMLVFVGVMIIPTTVSVLLWVNEKTGDEPYFVWDKSNGCVELPRVSKVFPKEQLREIVFLDRFVEVNRFAQCALLVEEHDRWSYAHLFNQGGASTGMKIFGGKELYEKLADELGIESRSLRFKKKESQSLN